MFQYDIVVDDKSLAMKLTKAVCPKDHYYVPNNSSFKLMISVQTEIGLVKL